MSIKEEVKIGDIFKGFNNFVKGIIAGLRYAMTYYIMADNPTLDGMEAIKQSKAMRIETILKTSVFRIDPLKSQFL